MNRALKIGILEGEEAARLMGQAVERVIRERIALTGDLGGKATTSAMGDAIAALV